MPANLNQVRAKETKKSKKSKFYLFIGLAAMILIAVTLTLAFTALSDKLNFISAPLEIVSEGNRQIIRVPSGGNLQEAINKAQSGDIIELQAGGTYYGEIKLPNKTITDYITIQSSAAKQLPENQRVKPSQANLMAKIVTRGQGNPAVSTENGAHHFRFIGIEFTPNSADYIYNLVYLTALTNKVSDVPHHFEFDRCYFHPYKSGVTRRGVGLNSAVTTIKNSYFEGFAFPQEETQAICGWTGTKDVHIINNYLEGGAENVMFGGSDPASAELIPSDIEVSRNHINKPAGWKGKNSVKCLFELKNAKRVQFVGNYLENNWLGAAFRVTVRNQDGKAPFSTIEDVLIQDNIVNGAGEGINILGKDDTYPSQTLKHLTITNNLFLNIGTQGYEGGGFFIQVADGEDILIANNTAFNMGNITTFYGTMPRNFLFRDNIVGHGNYGIHGLENIKSPVAQKLFQNNIIVNNRNVGTDDTSFPTGNFWLPDYNGVGFTNFAQKDFRLSSGSRFKGKGNNKSDIGSSLNGFSDAQ